MGRRGVPFFFFLPSFSSKEKDEKDDSDDVILIDLQVSYRHIPIPHRALEIILRRLP